MRRLLLVLALALVTLGAATGAAAQHNETGAGHLLDPILPAGMTQNADGSWGKIEFVGKLTVPDAEEGLIADVAVDPDGDYAYLARWGGSECAGPEGAPGGRVEDGGVYVIDIRNDDGSIDTTPELVGFIPTHQDTLVGEGMQVVEITTPKFSGDVLVINHEQCGKNGKGGVSLWDVTNPLKPKKLSENFGDITVNGARDTPDVNQTHSAFAWDAGDRAYLVATDDEEATDVDIFDITDPKHPVLIAELDLNTFVPGGIDQPELGLTDSFLHDMVVKQIDGRFIMLLSYWDGGYVLLDVTDPASPEYLGDSEFTNPDPELLQQFGSELTPEGNAHQAEFTSDNQFVIGTDEDFAPYRVDEFRITSGPNVGVYPSVIVPGGASPAILDDLTLDGPVVYGGYGCPDSAPIPSPEDIPGYLDMLEPGEETIIVLQRGPSGDPSAPEAACFPGEKAHEAALAGWDAVLFVQRHVSPDDPFCGSGAFVDEIVAVCTTHEAFHKLFNTVSGAYPDNPPIGTIGERIEVTTVFDGWGYVHLFDANLRELDTYAIPEAMLPAFARGYGDLSVHEVAVDPHPDRVDTAYLSYYSGGLRAIQIVSDAETCEEQGDTAPCLVEVGGFIDPLGNNFWGVQTFIDDATGDTIILASDRDSGLWIFRDP